MKAALAMLVCGLFLTTLVALSHPAKAQQYDSQLLSFREGGCFGQNYCDQYCSANYDFRTGMYSSSLYCPGYARSHYDKTAYARTFLMVWRRPTTIAADARTWGAFHVYSLDMWSSGGAYNAYEAQIWIEHYYPDWHRTDNTPISYYYHNGYIGDVHRGGLVRPWNGRFEYNHQYRFWVQTRCVSDSGLFSWAGVHAPNNQEGYGVLTEWWS